jgi:hypothetical protein
MVGRYENEAMVALVIDGRLAEYRLWRESGVRRSVISLCL